jgi:signal transduction histidine kinase
VLPLQNLSGDPAQDYFALKGRGLGLTSMKERLKLVGGELSIDSKPSNASTIGNPQILQGFDAREFAATKNRR